MLAEKRAEVRALDAEVRVHRVDCEDCRRRLRCPDRVALDEDLKAARHEVAHWFDPGENDIPLW